MSSKRLALLGVPINAATESEAINEACQLVDQQLRNIPPRYFATVNLDYLVNTWGWKSTTVRHPQLLRILQDAAFCTADGMPLVWLSEALGTPLPERVTGADLTLSIAARAAEEGKSLFILGGAPGVADKATTELKKRYPSLNIVGTAAPKVDHEGKCSDEGVVDKITQARPDILYLALGSPKQELWYARYKERLNGVGIVIGIGGSLNFLIGRIHRAPLRWQNLGLEWLWRLLQEPSRLWRRYTLGMIKGLWLSIPYIVYSNLLRALSGSFSSLPMTDKKDHVVHIDLKDISYLSPAQQAELITARNSARKEGIAFGVINKGKRLTLLLRLARLGDF